MVELTRCSLSCINDCINLIVNGGDLDLVITKLDSLMAALEESSSFPDTIKLTAVDILSNVIDLLSSEGDMTSVPQGIPGRPRKCIPVSTLEFLKFKVTDIAKLYNVSRDTVSRRLRDAGLSIRSSYTEISEDDLKLTIVQILNQFPNTGYKRMKGFLLSSGIKVIDDRVRSAMRVVDPEGVYFRTLSNRAIIHRQYSVTYFNHLWHLDTNMKQIRWNIVIRSCIDGKSRTVVYLDTSGDHTAHTNLTSFMKAVSKYGIPFRTRSDKGGENIIYARTERIERYWRDVYYGYTSTMANLFTTLENDGLLNIDNPKHLLLRHTVFFLRINIFLGTFRNSWNSHPLSSESNYTPNQLMIMSLPPAHHELELGEVESELAEFYCNTEEDLIDTITSPLPLQTEFTEEENQYLANIDFCRHSDSLGYDIFLEALECLNSSG